MRKKSWIIMSCILLAAAVSGGQGRGTGTNGTSGTSGTGTWAEEPVDREAVTEPEDTAKEDGAQVVPMEVEPVTETVGGPGMKGDDSLGDVPASVIFPQGMTLETRFLPSAGYERVPAEEGSFLAFMRNQKLKEDGSPVLLYDGTEKHNQSAQAAVFAMPGFDSDLQQCADSVMRMYAEYFYSVGAYEKIAFHLTNGFLMDYPTWREGNRLSVDGNRVSWVKKASYDDSYETFLLYLKYVMMYAGTLSMDGESEPVDIGRMQAGDLFIKGGSPGHCVMVTDVAADQDGNLCFLLSQSYMPAQDFHVLNNPLHEEDPWYYVSELQYPNRTPEYGFQEGSFKRWYGFRQ